MNAHTHHDLANGIGFTAATLTTLAFLPQLLRVIRLRSARELSLGMFLVFSAGVALWLVYGVLTGTTPVILANAVTLLLSVSILVLKLRFDARDRRAAAASSQQPQPTPPQPLAAVPSLRGEEVSL